MSDGGGDLSEEMVDKIHFNAYLEGFRRLLESADYAIDRSLAEAIGAAIREVELSSRKFPTWPTDPMHALVVLGEEFGELTQAVHRAVYKPEKMAKSDVRAEAIQTAAMAIRFIMSLDRYEFAKGVQHRQLDNPDAAASGCVTGGGSRPGDGVEFLDGAICGGSKQ